MAWRSCWLLLRHTGVDVSRSSVRTRSRCPHSFQQQRSFRRASRKPESRKVEAERSPTQSSESRAPHWPATPPHWEQPVPPNSPRAWARLVRPLVFTVGFTGSAFGSAAIWQYESLRSRVQSYFDEVQADWLEKLRPQKRGDVRGQINQWWLSLTEGQRTVTGIIAANALVFLCWRLPALRRSMVQYFTSSPASKTLCTPMILCCFSHFSFLHMAINMYVLWSFSTSAVSMLGREQFMAVYLSAGVISSFASYTYKMATGRFAFSLGASGAIMAVLATVCTKMPEAKLCIIFFPMFIFTAANALKAIVAVDTVGVLLRWRFFDHAAHLGGAIFGICYALWGQQLIWTKREHLVKLWHDLRSRGRR